MLMFLCLVYSLKWGKAWDIWERFNTETALAIHTAYTTNNSWHWRPIYSLDSEGRPSGWCARPTLTASMATACISPHDVEPTSMPRLDSCVRCAQLHCSCSSACHHVHYHVHHCCLDSHVRSVPAHCIYSNNSVLKYTDKATTIFI